jgi:hypothetical protein
MLKTRNHVYEMKVMYNHFPICDFDLEIDERDGEITETVTIRNLNKKLDETPLIEICLKKIDFSEAFRHLVYTDYITLSDRDMKIIKEY